MEIYEANKFIFKHDHEPQWFTDYEHKSVVHHGSFSAAYIYSGVDGSNECRKFLPGDVIKREDLFEW